MEPEERINKDILNRIKELLHIQDMDIDIKPSNKQLDLFGKKYPISYCVYHDDKHATIFLSEDDDTDTLLHELRHIHQHKTGMVMKMYKNLKRNWDKVDIYLESDAVNYAEKNRKRFKNLIVCDDINGQR